MVCEYCRLPFDSCWLVYRLCGGAIPQQPPTDEEVNQCIDCTQSFTNYIQLKKQLSRSSIDRVNDVIDLTD